MNLNNYIRSTTIHKTGQNSIHMKHNCDQSIANFFRDHPAIAVGELSPEMLKKYNITTTQNHILCTKVSHSLKDQPYISLNKKTQMSKDMILIPSDVYNKNLRPKSNIFLKDQGNDTQQEEKSIEIMQRWCNEGGKTFNVSVYNENTGDLESKKIAAKDVNVYNSRVEKIMAYSKITSYSYDEFGAVISVPATGSPVVEQQVQEILEEVTKVQSNIVPIKLIINTTNGIDSDIKNHISKAIVEVQKKNPPEPPEFTE
jgi:hypothetical protein